MKIKPEHLEHMRTAIDAVVARYPIARYRAENPTFSDKRIRWDYWRASGLLQFTCTTLYTYLNDEHIDTALRAIIAEVENV